MLDEGTPLVAQIAERLAADIIDGSLAEGDRKGLSTEQKGARRARDGLEPTG